MRLFLFVFFIFFTILVDSQCNIDNFNVNIGTCSAPANLYNVSGNIQFTNPPSSGTLNIEVNNGVTIYDTILNAPFTSPSNWSISNIPSDGASITVSAYFSTNINCTANVTSTAPNSCLCIADIGSFTNNIVGDGANNYVLCFGDQIDLASNLDYTPPADENIGGIIYDPGIAYLAFSCLPSVFPPSPLYDNMGFPNDSCLIGILSYGDNYSNVNTSGAPPNFGVSYTNNTIYYVPITMYSNSGGFYAVSNNGNPYCYDMGAAIAVTYLPELVISEVIDSIQGSVEITVSGGYPDVFLGQYTVVNNGAGNVSSAIIDSSGGSFVISGLNGGSGWNYTIMDGNGCNITGSGIMGGSVGIKEWFLNFSIYPNPSKGILFIDFQQSVNGDIVIYNQMGKIVLKTKMNEVNVTIDTKSLESGIYFIQINDSNFNTIVKKFVKIN